MRVFWRRTDLPGLECLNFGSEKDTIAVASTVINLEERGVDVRYHWVLDEAWRTRSLEILQNGSNSHVLRIERRGTRGFVDGIDRPDLEGADEADLSFTPFCNTLPVRRLSAIPNAELTIETVFIDGNDLSVSRSRQRYIRKSASLVRYIDLGVVKGFEADLCFGVDGFVERYECLFERVSVAASRRSRLS